MNNKTINILSISFAFVSHVIFAMNIHENEVDNIRNVLNSHYGYNKFTEEEVKNPFIILQAEQFQGFGYMQTVSRVGYDGYSRLDYLNLWGFQNILKRIPIRGICIFKNGKLLNMHGGRSDQAMRSEPGKTYLLRQNPITEPLFCYDPDYKFGTSKNYDFDQNM